MNWKYLFIFTINLFIINSSKANFYAYDKNVIELNETTFKCFVFNQNYASLVEFYNSFCGDCRRYLPTWRSLASDIRSWNDIVKVAGIDCSEHFEICRDYGIKFYPTIRYFSPYFKDEKNLGQETVHEEKSVMKVKIVNFLRKDTNAPKHWPNLTALPSIVDPKDVFATASNELKYLVFVYPGNSNAHIGYELTLDYHIESNFLIKQITAKKTTLELVIIGRDYKKDVIPMEAHHSHLDIRKILQKCFSECQGSKPNLRGYTCGLWTLFQYLTVRASTSSIQSNDPVEVLEAIHGFVKYFFGCTECSKHFQSMAEREGMWDVTSKQDAILWLWNAHNIVNDRLSGDSTDDPVFPKVKFPSKDECPQCRQYKNFGLDMFYRHARGFEFTWVKSEVLEFLRLIYSNRKISQFGTTSINEKLILPKKVVS